MKIKFLKGGILGNNVIGTIFCILILLASMATAININTVNNSTNSNQILCYTFLFMEPKIQTIFVNNHDYTLLDMQGCLAIGKNFGEPMMPIKPVSLLLPPMKTVKNIQVTGTPIVIQNYNLIEKPVFPYQPPVPFGQTPGDFIINNNVYSSYSVYPRYLYDNYQIGYSHGYTILNLNLNPVQYNPVEGTIKYYPEMTVNIELKDTNEMNHFFQNNPEDKAWVENLVYNKDILDFYTEDLPTFNYPGGLCDPSGHYDYVIITTTYNSLNYWETSSTLPYNWNSLMNHHATSYGLSCTLVTVQDIYACADYWNSTPLFNDSQARIREFCKDAYQDWETRYILIGGDGESNWIPARDMKTNYEGNIDADIYWSNLDNNFNADGDTYWGEEGDDGFDLYSELFIGRITCDEPKDVSNWIKKNLYYADSFDIEYLDNTGFYGGSTGWICQGDDFMDYSAIKGTDNWLGPIPEASGPFPTWVGFQFGFETWNEVHDNNQFDLSVKWTAEPPNPGWQGGSESAAINGLKNDINNDKVTLMSGVAHANPTMSLDVSYTAWESQYHNTKPFFLHDYGCHCGDFDAADDGVLHSMLFHSDTELAFGVVYNTCYGWGNFYCTNSSSAFQAKEFWSYFLDMENKSGDFSNWQLGKAHAYSKDRMAPTINWDYSYGTWRAIIQGCTLFSDPAQRIKPMSRPPETPERPFGPTNGLVGFYYKFSTGTTDPDYNQVYYKWDWGNGFFSDWIGPFDSGEVVEAFHSWANAGIYEIRVKAKDVHNMESSWSDRLRINIVDVPILEIGNISGDLFKIRVVIKNIGSTNATSVNWSITFIALDHGLIFLGRRTTGRVINVPVGGEVMVNSKPVFGFGKTIIIVTAESGVSSDSKKQEAFLLGFFIKMLTS